MIKKESYIKKLRRFFSAKLEKKDLPLPTEFLAPEEVKKLDLIKKTFQAKYSKLSEIQKQDFLDDFLVRFTYNTNAIDGNPLSFSATKKILLQEKHSSNKPENYIREVSNMRNAFKFILDYKGRINRKLMFDLHKFLMENVDSHAGKLRDHDVEIYGSHYMPTGYDVLRLDIEKLFDWFHNNKLHVFELACIFHLRLVSIHPFSDGNGRLARLLMNYILWKNGYPMIVIPVSKKRDYFNALESCHEENSPKPFIGWMKGLYIK
ncbi:Fic family protein [Candidatus Woesearchaeota archaeon]|nr:Fic family protein [Candidatus Woesearchaeota archaeon]